MIRSFIGLPLPDSAARELAKLQGGLPIARHVPRENLHLTLAYLDDQPEAVLRELAQTLGDMTVAPFDTRLSGLMLFGGKQPAAIAVGASGGKALATLQTRVARRVREAEIALERRRFRPHVTIFRLSKRVEQSETARIQAWIDSAPGFEPITFQADRMTLYRSRLAKDGASYEALADYPFEAREN